ncbi:MAG: hypothetical protein IMF08_17410, partial [Proteobacteria bacterium]|nr:hypothetical protein [Pseudomonadota bacterium]
MRSMASKTSALPDCGELDPVLSRVGAFGAVGGALGLHGLLLATLLYYGPSQPDMPPDLAGFEMVELPSSAGLAEPEPAPDEPPPKEPAPGPSEPEPE